MLAFIVYVFDFTFIYLVKQNIMKIFWRRKCDFGEKRKLTILDEKIRIYDFGRKHDFTFMVGKYDFKVLTENMILRFW